MLTKKQLSKPAMVLDSELLVQNNVQVVQKENEQINEALEFIEFLVQEETDIHHVNEHDESEIEDEDSEYGVDYETYF